MRSTRSNTCVGAKVNGRIVPLRTRLRNGDQVEVITSKAQTPSPGWESFAVTGKARACIRRFVRGQQREEYIQLGREIVENVFREEGYEFTDKAIEGVLKIFHSRVNNDLFALVGQGDVTGIDVLHAVYPGSKKRKGWRGRMALRHRRKGKKEPVAIKGLTPGVAVHLAGCCHPIPGDRIVGIQTTGKGVTIHTIDCETLESFSDMPYQGGGRQYAGQSRRAVHGGWARRRQYQQPENHRPLSGVFRDAHRHRGGRRQAVDRYRRSPSGDFGGKLGRTRARLTGRRCDLGGAVAMKRLASGPGARRGPGREIRCRRHHGASSRGPAAYR
jgi:hypothetical protein